MTQDPIELIKAYILANGWSRTDLALVTHYSKPRITEYLNRKRKIPLRFIRRIHKIAPTLPLEVLISEYEL
jgi:antitoxin component HigA of HigAB toxin-antitoxin module